MRGEVIEEYKIMRAVNAVDGHSLSLRIGESKTREKV